MQNRICDLCGHEIQDLMLAALDHSIPVIRYARCLDLAIEDAIRECNHPENLRAAHSSCNAAKNGRTREEWYAAGLNDRDKPRFLTDGQLLDLQFRLGAGGRVGGRTAGRRNVESGHWAHIHTLEHQSRAGLALASVRLNIRKQQTEWLTTPVGTFKEISRRKDAPCAPHNLWQTTLMKCRA